MPIHDKTLSKLGIERKFLDLIKNIYKKPTTNIKFSDEKLKDFLLRARARQGCPLSLLLFNIRL